MNYFFLQLFTLLIRLRQGYDTTATFWSRNNHCVFKHIQINDKNIYHSEGVSNSQYYDKKNNYISCGYIHANHLTDSLVSA